MSVASALASSLHDQLLAACRTERQAVHRLATLLARVARESLHVHLGYRSVLSYAVRALDLPFRKARDLLRLGERLTELPTLDAAVGSGDVSWTKARELLAVVTPENEVEWVDQARTRTSRQLERLVHKARAASAPSPATHVGRDRPARTTRHLDLETVQADVLDAALARLRSTTGVTKDEVSDGDLVTELARRYLYETDPADIPTTPRFVVILDQCPTCLETSARGVAPTDTAVHEAECDHLVVAPSGEVGPGTAAQLREEALRRDGYGCRIPGCTNTLWLDVHRVGPLGAEDRLDRLVTLCSVHHRVVHDGLLAVSIEAGILSVDTGRGEAWTVPLDPGSQETGAASDSGQPARPAPPVRAPRPGFAGAVFRALGYRPRSTDG